MTITKLNTIGSIKSPSMKWTVTKKVAKISMIQMRHQIFMSFRFKQTFD